MNNSIETSIGTLDKAKAVVFTRHQLTKKQEDEIRAIMLGTDWDGEIYVNDFAKEELKDWDDADGVFNTLLMNTHGIDVLCIFGVFPPVLRRLFFSRDGIKANGIRVELYEAWNVNRAEEGEKPTFEHKEWLMTGAYKIYNGAMNK